MKPLFILIFIFSVFAASAQQQTAKPFIRVVDTLTVQEKNTRNPILLRGEYDSIISAYEATRPKPAVQEPVTLQEPAIPLYIFIAMGALFAAVLVLLYFVINNQKKSARTIYRISKQLQHLEALVSVDAGKPASTSVTGSVKGKSVPALEKKISALTSELDKKTQELEGLEMVLSEYRHIKQEYESVKQQMMDIYKIRNYPGYAKEKSETEIIRGMLATERSVALYAYDHFLKPVIAIADANKNNPAKISAEEKDRVVDLLLSLALLYSEYLYLRVNDLAIGGKMVERINGFQKGNGIDKSLLKELNMDHGSRALALRMALDKLGVHKLTYPVFDETNLNLS